MDNCRLIQPTVKMGTDEEYNDLLNRLSPRPVCGICVWKNKLNQLQSLAAPQVQMNNLGLCF